MISQLLESLARAGLRRGLRGSTGWLAVGGAAWLWRRARAHHAPTPVWTQELAPGQAVLITHHPER